MVVVQSKSWCFTWNNYNDSDVDHLKALALENDLVQYIVFGRELAPTTLTPHLQGFAYFSKKVTVFKIKNLFGNQTIHLDRAIGTSGQAAEYCKKDGDWWEHGSYETGQGKRSDLDDFKDDVKSGIWNHSVLREKHSDVYAKYASFCRDYVNDKLPKPVVEQHGLRPWQSNLVEMLETLPDKRKIYFVVDEVGNQGKSWFARWYVTTKEKGQIIIPGKKADMAFVLDPLAKIYFLDCPRSKQGDFIQYDFLEECKNGYVFSCKYESRNCSFDTPHVVVLMNEMPDFTKLSADRYEVIRLGDL